MKGMSYHLTVSALYKSLLQWNSLCIMAIVPWLNYFCNSKNVIITYLYLKQYCIWGLCLLRCGRCVIGWMVPDFLKDHGAFIFKDHPLTHCHIPEDLNPQQFFVRTSNLTVLYFIMISLTLLAYCFQFCEVSVDYK